MVLDGITVTGVWKAFKLHYAKVYAWEYCGALPARPPKKITLEYLEALAAKVKASRGSITPEGEAMLTQARAEVKRRGGEPGATGTQCGGGCKGMGHESKHS